VPPLQRSSAVESASVWDECEAGASLSVVQVGRVRAAALWRSPLGFRCKCLNRLECYGSRR